MEQLKESITNQLGDIINIMDENELFYDETILYDIIVEGAGGILFHHELDFADFPDGLEIACDNIQGEVSDRFENMEQVYEFAEKLLDEFYS